MLQKNVWLVIFKDGVVATIFDGGYKVESTGNENSKLEQLRTTGFSVSGDGKNFAGKSYWKKALMKELNYKPGDILCMTKGDIYFM